MKKQVIFLQGVGEGAYEEDGELVKHLRDALGAEYNVLYPKMPEEESSGYEAWKARISKELAALKGKVILVGHSAGGSVLLKYLSETYAEKIPQATIRKFDGREHQFNNDLSEVAADIASL